MDFMIKHIDDMYWWLFMSILVVGFTTVLRLFILMVKGLFKKRSE
jgi:hypothetical protein